MRTYIQTKNKEPKNRELCPAPTLPGHLPPGEPELKALIEDNKENPQFFLTLGNYFFRIKNFLLAEKYFLEATSLRQDYAEAFCNLGILYTDLGKEKKAVQSFKKSIKLNPTLELPYKYLTITSLEADDAKSLATAKKYLKKILLINPQNIDCLISFGEILLSEDKISQAKKAFVAANKTLEEETNSTGEMVSIQKEYLIKKLSEVMFYESLKAFPDNFLKTFKSWQVIFKQTPGTFYESRKVFERYNELIKSFQNSPRFLNLLQNYREKIISTYEFSLWNFFALGLLPEVFDEEKKLPVSQKYWHSTLKTNPEYAYGLFRLGIIYTYLGKWDEALRYLNLSADKIPAKKQESLKLPGVISFIELQNKN